MLARANTTLTKNLSDGVVDLHKSTVRQDGGSPLRSRRQAGLLVSQQLQYPS